MPAVEISVESVEAALAAEAGGAQRIELCSSLREGGLTPSLGLLRTTRSRCSLSLQVLIRPRAGDFLYTADEFAVMREDIATAKREGAEGVVLGLLTPAGTVDVPRTQELTALAQPMEVTFHRALDMALDLDAALEDVIRCGCDRVLTSGGASTALLGQRQLRSLVHASAGRIAILAGGGVRPDNVVVLAQMTDVTQFHASLRRAAPSPMQHIRPGLHLGQAEGIEYARTVVTAEDVCALVTAVQQIPRPAAARS